MKQCAKTFKQKLGKSLVYLQSKRRAIQKIITRKFFKHDIKLL